MRPRDEHVVSNHAEVGTASLRVANSDFFCNDGAAIPEKVNQCFNVTGHAVHDALFGECPSQNMNGV